MSEKHCTKCKILKPLSEFRNDITTKTGKRFRCKKCEIIDKESYRKTKIGLIGVIYGSQRYSSKNRDHDMPPYSVHQLRYWVLAQPLFHELYDKWVLSGHNRWLKPSCDRTDDDLSYSLNRLEIKTWKENSLKWNSDVMDGTSHKQCRPVIQMNMDGIFVKEWHSIASARKVFSGGSHINCCCTGRRKTAGGYRWMYSLGIPIHNNGVK